MLNVQIWQLAPLKDPPHRCVRNLTTEGHLKTARQNADKQNDDKQNDDKHNDDKQIFPHDDEQKASTPNSK